MKNRKVIKLKWGNTYGTSDYSPIIQFDDMHPMYGRAEFQICPIFKYGKLKKVIIYRVQQETNEIYEIKAQGQKEFQICSWQHKGVDNPNIWREFWCKEHKTICHEVYVPKDTNTIEFESLSSFGIRFVKRLSGDYPSQTDNKEVKGKRKQMKTKLKTLKDLAREHFGENPRELGFEPIITHKLLRQEAIKWIKELDKEYYDNIPLLLKGESGEDIQDWIKYFFNITEDELSGAKE